MRLTIVKPILLLALLFFVKSGYAQNPCPNTVSELVVNGNFNAGNTGFATKYAIIAPTGSTAGGDYGVGTNPNAYNTRYFVPMGDHTTGTGNFLIADGESSNTSYVWQESVNVIVGQVYFFSAWFANIDSNVTSPNICYDNPAQLVFQIAGIAVGNTIQVDCHDHKWVQFFTSWKAPATATINLTIQDVLAQSNGNDFGLDDISFTTGCGSITNLSAFGSNASVPDINECDFAFPYSITSGLPNSGAGYTFQWKNSALSPLTGTSTNNSYTFTTAPAPGKYYLCYDTLGCWKADSFMVNKALTFSIAPNQNLCPPIDYTIAPTPTPTATNLTYSWKLGTNTIPGANSSTYQATQDGTYTLTVTSTTPGCGPATAQMTLTSPTSPLAGTVTCSSGNYQFSATSGTYNVIGANSNVAWYNSPTTTTAFASSPDNVSATVPNTSLVNAPGCGEGGLYAQDLNSYYTTLGPTTAPSCSYTITNATAGAMLIVVYNTVTINSLQFLQLNNSTSESPTYTAEILSNSPGSGPYSSGCGCNTDGPGAAILASEGPKISPSATTTPVVQTLTFGSGGSGYTLTGSPTGTKYWIQIAGSEFAYYQCASYPYSNSPNPGVIQLTEQDENTNIVSHMLAYNINLTEGTPNPCSRLWVCASASCPAPVKFMYIQAQNQGAENTITWATAMELNNRYFVVERSADAINFTSLDTVAGAGNSSVIRDYSYIDNYAYDGIVYYRIKQVDMNGDYMYSDIAEVSSQSSGLVRFYPIPVKDGQNLNIDFKSSIAGTATIIITDMVGRQQLQVLKSVGKGGNTISVSTASLEQGTYIIELYTPDGNKTIERIVVN